MKGNSDEHTSKLLETPKIKSNGLKRTITGLSLLGYFGLAVYVGPPMILLNGLFIQLKCFEEVINIAYNIKNIPDIPLFRTQSWYFLFVANYFFSGETLLSYMGLFVRKYRFLQFLVNYHRFISYCLYFSGIIWFLMSMRKSIIRKQFSIFFWTQFLIIFIALQSYMIVENLYQGIIWLVLPMWLVILNDVFSYVFGSLYGKTPLISLSPKKTVEGFILGGLSTVVLGALLCHWFCMIQYLVCPIKYAEVNDSIVMDTNCTRSYYFQPIPYEIGNTGYHLNFYPFQFQCLALSFFASIIAPFGGFCASGFKRGVKVKDFGNIIPGHGGMMDRFDCQFLMATFVNVYISTFVRSASVEGIFQKVLYLSEEKQVEFYQLLRNSLESGGYLKG